MHRRATQQPVAAAGLGLDGVKGDGSDDGERHEARHGSVRLAMRAVTISAFGGPEVLELVEDAPVPEPGEGQVLVRVSRAGINFADTHARENSYLSSYELPLIPGGEVAGEVDGKRVAALVGTGGYAEYARGARRARCSRSPTASRTRPRSR